MESGCSRRDGLIEGLEVCGISRDQECSPSPLPECKIESCACSCSERRVCLKEFLCVLMMSSVDNPGGEERKKKNLQRR